MKPSSRKTFLAFVSASAVIGLIALTTVLSLSSPEADDALAFLSGFGGTLVAGLSVPWSRRQLLESFQSETEKRPQMRHRAAGLRRDQHLYASVWSGNQHVRLVLRHSHKSNQPTSCR